MEKQSADTQRVLWAVVAVSLLVVVVLAGGLYFLRPRGAQEAEITVTYADGSPFDPFEYVRDDQETPGLIDSTEPTRQVSLVVGDLDAPAASPAFPDTSGRLTPRAAPSSASSLPVASSLPAASSPSAAPAPAAAAPAPSRTAQPAATRPAAPVAAAPAPTPAPAPAPRAAGGHQYWIQVGSFSSRSRADDLYKLLSGQGYAGRITAHDAGGVTMHRVRIGPYASRPEADRLLGTLRSRDMDGWIAQG